MQGHEPARRVEGGLRRSRVVRGDQDRGAHVGDRGVAGRIPGRDVARELGLELGDRPRREAEALAGSGNDRLGLGLRGPIETRAREQLCGVRKVRALGVGDRFRVLQHDR